MPHDGTRESASNPSHVDFSIGDDLDLLYVTVDKSRYRIRLNATGDHIPWAG